MKIIKYITAALLSLSLSASAVQVTLEWDANAPTDGVIEYIIKETSTVGPVEIARTQNTSQILDLTPGAYTFVVTARNMWGESGPSNAVSTPGVPSKPAALRLKVAVNSDGTAKITIDGAPWHVVTVEKRTQREWKPFVSFLNLTGHAWFIDRDALNKQKNDYRASQTKVYL